MEVATHTSRAALRPGTAAVVKKISRPGLRCGESSRFRGNARVCQFHAADNSVNTCVVPPRGFGGAASFSVFQLWAQVGATQWALPTTLPEPVAKSLLDVGDVVTRRQDTSPHTRPGGRDICGRPAFGTGLRFLSPAARLPWRECDLQTPESSPISEPRKLRLELRRN